MSYEYTPGQAEINKINDQLNQQFIELVDAQIASMPPKPPRYFKYTAYPGERSERRTMFDLEKVSAVNIVAYESPCVVCEGKLYHCSREVAEKIMELLEKRG